MTILTIGHSTRSFDEFVALLRAHHVDRLADIRTVPRSRRHPHFSRDALETALPREGIRYRHFPDLGGLRKPRPDSPNGGWRVESFRGYADHMQTPAFAAAIDDLLEFSSDGLASVMCAEAKWWQCHRQLVADALVARAVEVGHIMSPAAPAIHALTPFARVGADRGVTYPALV